jgi:hypothetical protein
MAKPPPFANDTGHVRTSCGSALKGALAEASLRRINQKRIAILSPAEISGDEGISLKNSCNKTSN